MNDKAKVGITAILAVSATLIVAIIVTGFVLGEPTMLIPGYRATIEARAEAQAQRDRATVAENALWHKNNPGRD